MSFGGYFSMSCNKALRKEITDGLKKDLSASGIPVYLKA